MATIPVIAPTCVRITFNHNLGNGRHAAVVNDFSFDEAPLEDRADAIPGVVEAIRDHWQDNVMPGMANSISFTGGTYTDLDSLAGISGSFGPNTSKPVNSGSTVATCPPNVAYIFTKHAAHTRSQRPGRLFLPGVVEAEVDNQGDITNDTHFNLVQSNMQNFRSDVNALDFAGATIAWRVVHVTGHGPAEPGYPQGRPNAWGSSDISAITLQRRVATQRRRNRG